jgi:putative transposase
MANHVHLLITPKVAIERITKGIKGVSSRRANIILGRTGTIFWQQESFDHWIRNESEMERVRGYIERNPVSAGLVKTPAEWRWSSATGVQLAV